MCYHLNLILLEYQIDSLRPPGLAYIKALGVASVLCNHNNKNESRKGFAKAAQTSPVRT